MSFRARRFLPYQGDFVDNRSKREIQDERRAYRHQLRQTRGELGAARRHARSACSERRLALRAERDELLAEYEAQLRKMRGELHDFCSLELERATRDLEHRSSQLRDRIQELMDEERGVRVEPRITKVRREAANVRWRRYSEWVGAFFDDLEDWVPLDFARRYVRFYHRDYDRPNDAANNFMEWMWGNCQDAKGETPCGEGAEKLREWELEIQDRVIRELDREASRELGEDAPSVARSASRAEGRFVGPVEVDEVTWFGEPPFDGPYEATWKLEDGRTLLAMTWQPTEGDQYRGQLGILEGEEVEPVAETRYYDTLAEAELDLGNQATAFLDSQGQPEYDDVGVPFN